MDLDRVCIKDQVEKATTESTLEFPRMPSKTDKERAFCWGLISSTLSITARKGGELFRVMEMWFQRQSERYKKMTFLISIYLSIYLRLEEGEREREKEH